jgi:hypothetical protein
MQRKGDLQNFNLKDDVGIKVMKRLYSLKFKKYIYYHWIQKSKRRNYKAITHKKKGRYHLAPTNHTLQFIPTSYTNTYDVNL